MGCKEIKITEYYEDTEIDCNTIELKGIMWFGFKVKKSNDGLSWNVRLM